MYHIDEGKLLLSNLSVGPLRSTNSLFPTPVLSHTIIPILHAPGGYIQSHRRGVGTWEGLLPIWPRGIERLREAGPGRG